MPAKIVSSWATQRLAVVIVLTSLWLGIASRLGAAQDAGQLPDAPSAVAAARWPAVPAAADPQPASASKYPASLGATLKRGLCDQAEIYSAPFHRSALKWDAAVVAVTGGLIASDRHLSGELSRDHLNVSRDISNAALAGELGGLGVVWLTGVTGDNPRAKETGYLGTEAVANSLALYTVMNVITGRQRPVEGDGKGHFFKNNTLDSSFPSGHAIVAWTAASEVSHEYPKPWVEFLAYGTATAVSLTRFTSLQHFPSDVVVGSTLGYLIGSHIFHAHCKAGLSPACHRR